MKESKFIELLNLYLDHEISPADAALLEAEIQRHPERRQTYREYCQMQKACVLLADNFRDEAPAAVSAGEIIAFAPAGQNRTGLYAAIGGLAAAAACAAVVFLPRGNQIVATPEAPALAVAPVVAPPVPVPRAELQPAFAGLVRDSGATAPAMAVADRPAFAWMNQVQPQRLPLEQLRFETQRTIEPSEYLLSGRAPTQAQIEMTAFRFTK